MVLRRLVWTLPHGVRGDFEVLERTTPGFHRVRSDPCVPVQLVDGEVAMLDRRQYRREPHVLHMGVRPELQPVETHRHAPGYHAAESPGKKIRNLEATVVDSIAAAAGESCRVKVHIRERDVLPGITPVALELAAGELAFSAYLDPPCRNVGLAQGFSDIQQLDPAAVPETPLRIRETIHFRLCIEMGVPRTEYPLLEREAIAP